MFDTLLLASTFVALVAGLAAGAIGVVLGAVADDALTRRAAAVAAAAGGDGDGDGDGAIDTVVQQVLGSGRPLGLLAQGTFNRFDRAHGVPADPHPAAIVVPPDGAPRLRVPVPEDAVEVR
jgi:diacylglycerol kinase (ATP)